MSPAKRKVGASTKRSRKTSRAKPRAASGSARKAGSKVIAACDMPASKLAAAFDRPEGAAPLLRHVPECGACTTSLTALAAAGQGLKHLTADGAGTAVERVLAKGQAHGQKKLADLVYELAKACLVVVHDVDRRMHFDERPRSQDVIARDVRGVTPRLSGSAHSAAEKLPSAKPTEERALSAAASCISILKQIEGPSDRQRLSKAVCLICSGKPLDAERVLEGVLARGASGAQRRSALNNLVWALVRQGKAKDAQRMGIVARSENPNSWMANYNLAVAAALDRKRALVKSCATALSRLPAASQPEARRRGKQLAYEVPRFAGWLGCSVPTVASWFGLKADEIGATNEVG